MLKAITKHLTPATGIAFIALIFAITGGAFAATGGSGGSGSGSHASATLTASAAKAKSKAKAGPRGPAGKNGTNGTNGAPGATGPAGPTGPAGGAGTPGTPGTNGTNGTNGESVKAEPAAKPAECKEGGTKLTVAGKSEKVCNGEKGKEGNILPVLGVGTTETGSIAYQKPTEEAGGSLLVVSLAISFAIPLAAELDHEHVELVEAGKTGSKCTGTPAEPTAPSGVLCVYLAHQPAAFAGAAIAKSAAE